MKDEYEKQDFIVDYIKKSSSVDILNVKFVDEYILKFNPPHKIQYWGANKCTEIGTLLSKMYKCNLLNRSAIGLNRPEPGFPKWVYCYYLKIKENKSPSGTEEVIHG